MPHISIKAESLFSLFGVHITNSLLTSWVVLALLFVIAFLYQYSENVAIVVDFVLKGLYELFHSIFHGRVNVFFPLLATFFIYIVTLNWFGLLPGVGAILVRVEERQERVIEEKTAVSENQQILVTAEHNEEALPVVSKTGQVKEPAEGIVMAETEAKVEAEEHPSLVPLLRGGTADLNTTLALSVFSVLLIQVYAIKYLGFMKYVKKFINLSNPINAFVGLLEIISEVSKALSFSFRLFGNIFAGEVLLTVVAFLVPVLASFPFLLFEFFVGFIQALVFSMLSGIFLQVAISDTNH